jgi:hypothetical protein
VVSTSDVKLRHVPVLGFVKVGACVVEQVVPADPPPLPPGGWSFRARRRLGAARALFMARRELVNKMVCIVWCVCVFMTERCKRMSERTNRDNRTGFVTSYLCMYCMYLVSYAKSSELESAMNLRFFASLISKS